VCCDEGLTTHLVEAVRESDEDSFDSVYEAVQKLQIEKQFMEVCRVVFSLMHLMDLEFVEEEEEKENCEDYSPSSYNDQEFGLSPEDAERVSVACSILGLKENALVDSFIAQKLSLGKDLLLQF
jgi:hypothetical protein